MFIDVVSAFCMCPLSLRLSQFVHQIMRLEALLTIPLLAGPNRRGRFFHSRAPFPAERSIRIGGVRFTRKYRGQRKTATVKGVLSRNPELVAAG
jgi:hypothetical protein